ncbi:MAG: sulfate ABC transporter [Candidatus Handelsmanbacteria bacterium RIFCSPLOWO2_12_FULL_64_10]|uniref:Sulfate ABC transporter n=1 Tax=Handelsmanbacteria sp. (strain RIFCSPLOWO2_12_FULL_64_10) TaxID=1817868 RepID=A0A1F6D469_HANXR|nr:MAG: sulfate ABC transporter [Candidatus Handelsmanbacteria bacterium RIFCSPLOWO2_12_FULL_64_10]
MSIEVRGVTKRFGNFTALDDVSVEVPSGSLVALLGPSGSGKTTLLRAIAGLETPDAGTIYFHDEDATDRPVRHRNVGFVFQHYALFRHMTIFDNIAFGLQVRKRPKEEIRERVHELLRLIQLEGVENRYPAQLSGGQRQRVALARALAARPKVLLLDEPFGALDAKVRKELRQWIRRLHDEIHVTSLFVTHDQEEALELADRVVLMHDGKVEQVGTPDEVYNRPATPFVMNFLGSVNIFHGRVRGDRLSLAAGLEADAPAHVSGEDRGVVAFVRPHDIDVDLSQKNGSSACARVKWIHPIGAVVKMELELLDDKKDIEVELTRERHETLRLSVGEIVYVTPKGLKVFVGTYSI